MARFFLRDDRTRDGLDHGLMQLRLNDVVTNGPRRCDCLTARRRQCLNLAIRRSPLARFSDVWLCKLHCRLAGKRWIEIYPPSAWWPSEPRPLQGEQPLSDFFASLHQQEP